MNILNSEELKKALKISEGTLRMWRDKRKIPFYKADRSYRYDLDAVLKALQVDKASDER